MYSEVVSTKNVKPRKNRLVRNTTGSCLRENAQTQIFLVAFVDDVHNYFQDHR